VTISRRLQKPFEAAGLSLRTLENRTVRVRGWIERRGGPRIQVFAPGQIEVVGEDEHDALKPRSPSRPPLADAGIRTTP
jgi:hypothetical protein